MILFFLITIHQVLSESAVISSTLDPFEYINMDYSPLPVDTTDYESDCGELGDCLSVPQNNCNLSCGCDTLIPYYFNETVGECRLDFKGLLKKLKSHYGDQEQLEDIKVERVFQRIWISAILVIVSVVIGFFAACTYCIRIHYSDTKLKKDIESYAHKFGREARFRTVKKKSLPPISESCNVVVEDAGVFVV